MCGTFSKTVLNTCKVYWTSSNMLCSSTSTVAVLPSTADLTVFARDAANVLCLENSYLFIKKLDALEAKAADAGLTRCIAIPLTPHLAQYTIKSFKALSCFRWLDFNFCLEMSRLLRTRYFSLIIKTIPLWIELKDVSLWASNKRSDTYKNCINSLIKLW